MPEEDASDPKSNIIITRLASVEREIAEIKRLIAAPNGGRLTLQGIWKGLEVADEDIAAAKRSW